MNRNEIIDARYVAKVLFLCLTSMNFGSTFNCLWLGIPFALYFLLIGCLNATRRREFSKRPKYRKLPAYLAIVPLALYWIITPGVENGVNPAMVFLPGLYLLFLTALQERSRGNGGFEAFVNFNGMVVLLCSAYQAPRMGYIAVLVAILLILFSSCRRGTAFYKYIFFLILLAILGGIAFSGWQYWKMNHGAGSRFGREYINNRQMMGFDPVNALGSFADNYNSRYNSQVVLRVWDENPPEYLVAARYDRYGAGSWQLPREPQKTLTPAYYQVDYSVMELSDSATRRKNSRAVWVQSTLDNFGFLFAPNGAVGFSAKDVDSLHYFSGGMVTGLNRNGSRSDWYYYPCSGEDCDIARGLSMVDSMDLVYLPRFEGLLDTVIETMGLVPMNQSGNGDAGIGNLLKIRDYFQNNFVYSLQVPELDKRRIRNTEDPLHVFWRTKKGYCEYYATLTALSLRRLGYPARYVTGFVHPEKSEGRPYAIFRRKNSHSWVEVYVNGSWLVFDPTPAAVSFSTEESSWFADFWDGIQARTAKLLHLIKDGQWRTAVDYWQSYLEGASESPVLYGVVALLVLGLISRRIYVARRNKANTISARSDRAKEWARKLTQAEFHLSRAGLVREGGESVGHFLLRIQDLPLDGRASTARYTLQEYEKNRWTL